MLPGSRTRDVICKAAPFSVSQRVPPKNGSPPSPRATTRPPARFIEDNIVLCGHRLRRCHADCFPPSPAARGPRRVAVTAPACRQSGTPVRPLPPWGEIWRGKTPSPHPTPDARPLPSPRGLRQLAGILHASRPRRRFEMLARGNFSRARLFMSTRLGWNDWLAKLRCRRSISNFSHPNLDGGTVWHFIVALAQNG